jgi:hypothetical protein
LTQRFDAVGKQQGGATGARSGQRSLGSGVPATDNNYLIKINSLHIFMLRAMKDYNVRDDSAGNRCFT